MVSVPQPFLQLVVNGKDVTSDLDPHVLDFSYEDKLHGKADEIEVTLRDDAGLWRGAWRPEHGDLVEAAIGYRGGPVMPCGLFEVDEPEASGDRSGGDVLTFRALSAKPSTGLRTKRTEAYEDQGLSDIAGKVAARNGMTLTGEIDDVRFKRVTQRRERDLEFLTRLAEDTGHYFTAKGAQAVFASRASVAGREVVRAFDLVAGTPIVRWRLKEPTHRTYSKARVQYLDPDRKQLITVEAEDVRVKTGDTLSIDERVEDEASAKRLAQSRLDAANAEGRTGSLDLVGDPLLVAGQVIELGSTFGKYAGRWLVNSARHRISRGGYTTAIEIKGA